MFIGLLIILLAACDAERPPCLEPRTVSLIAGCYRHEDTGLTDIDTLLPNLNAAGLFADSVRFWLVGADNVRQFPLTLSSLRDSCQWAIQPDSGTSPIDTITFYYSRELHFLSFACGYTYYFSLKGLRWTRNNIDSMVIRNATINGDVNTQHVRIYF